MLQNKKKVAIISIVILAVLIGLGFYLYPILFPPAPGIYNLNGVVKLIEGNSLRVWANVPESSSFSSGVPNYIEKEYTLIIGSDSSLYGNEVKIDGNYLTRLNSAEAIKENSVIGAIVKENILKNTELNVVELTIVQ